MSLPSPMESAVARVYSNPRYGLVTIVLDRRTASIVAYAVRALAAECEGHAREVRAVAAALPDGSYGQANRFAIASRHARLAARLRLLDRSYRLAEG